MYANNAILDRVNNYYDEISTIYLNFWLTVKIVNGFNNANSSKLVQDWLPREKIWKHFIKVLCRVSVKIYHFWPSLDGMSNSQVILWGLSLMKTNRFVSVGSKTGNLADQLKPKCLVWNVAKSWKTNSFNGNFRTAYLTNICYVLHVQYYPFKKSES